MRGTIFDLKKYSIHDGPGIRTTVFFKGCPLRCAWCHNPEGIAPARELMVWENRCTLCGTCLDVCQNGGTSLVNGSLIVDRARCTLCGDCVEACVYEAREIVGREVTVAQVMAEIEKDVIFYDESGGGATFSGGEPLLQPDFLAALLQACQEREIHTAVDTTGFAAPTTLDRISPHVDLFLYDLKLMDDERHRKFTGVSNELILSNLQKLASEKRSIVVRIPLIPGINDDDENLVQAGKFVSALDHPPCVDLLPYHATGIEKYRRLAKEYGLLEAKPPSDERMSQIAATLRGFGLQVAIGG